MASLVVSLSSLVICGLAAPVGAILGHVAVGQIDRTGEAGRGMAVAGIVIGWVITALGLLVIILAVAIGLAFIPFGRS